MTADGIGLRRVLKSGRRSLLSGEECPPGSPGNAIKPFPVGSLGDQGGRPSDEIGNGDTGSSGQLVSPVEKAPLERPCLVDRVHVGQVEKARTLDGVHRLDVACGKHQLLRPSTRRAKGRTRDRGEGEGISSCNKGERQARLRRQITRSVGRARGGGVRRARLDREDRKRECGGEQEGKTDCHCETSGVKWNARPRTIAR